MTASAFLVVFTSTQQEAEAEEQPSCGPLDTLEAERRVQWFKRRLASKITSASGPSFKSRKVAD